MAQQSRVQANQAALSGAESGQPSLLVAAVTLKRCLLSPGSAICALTFDLYFFSTALNILGVGGGSSKNNFRGWLFPKLLFLPLPVSFPSVANGFFYCCKAWFTQKILFSALC